jgi:hypothetical protein
MRSRLAVLLIAALLNVAGSPMAWANLLGGAAAETATHEELADGCHGQAQATDQLPAPDSMPCCDGGGCYCAAPALPMPIVPQTTRLPHQGVSAAFDTSALPANPLDDSLRPPIR